MSRPSAALLFIAFLLASCGNSLRDKAKVQAAIVHRLESSSGLDLKTLDVNTTSVTFDKNLAYATVAFHPKGNPSLDHGMQMKYTLEAKNGQWEVVKVGDSQGHGLGGPAPRGSSSLPPGHPPVDGAASGDPHTPADGSGIGGQRP